MPLLSRRFGLLVLALLLAACQAPHGAKQSASAAASATQVPPAQRTPGPYRVTLLGDGSEVELLGEISVESIAALQQVLAENPQVRVLQLTSPGGSGKAVDQIWPALMQRQLTTVVPLFCASACAELFLAGDRRVLAEGAVLGYHQSFIRYARGMDTDKVGLLVAAYNSEVVDRLLERGVAPAFAQKVIATPPDQLWFPTRQELSAAGVLTQRSAAAGFAAPSTGRELANLLDWSIFSSRLESAYRDAFPEDYATLRASAWKAVKADGFESTLQLGLMAAALETAIPRALSVASDAAAAAYVRALAAGMAFLANEQPQDCYRLISRKDLAQAARGSEGEERVGAYYVQALRECRARSRSSGGAGGRGRDGARGRAPPPARPAARHLCSAGCGPSTARRPGRVRDARRGRRLRP